MLHVPLRRRADRLRRVEHDLAATVRPVADLRDPADVEPARSAHRERPFAHAPDHVSHQGSSRRGEIHDAEDASRDGHPAAPRDLQSLPGRPLADAEVAAGHLDFAPIEGGRVGNRDGAGAVQPVAAGADEHPLGQKIGRRLQPRGLARRLVAQGDREDRLGRGVVKRLVVGDRARRGFRDHDVVVRGRHHAARPVGGLVAALPAPRAVPLAVTLPGDRGLRRHPVELAERADGIEALEREAVAVELRMAGGTGALAGVQGELLLERGRGTRVAGDRLDVRRRRRDVHAEEPLGDEHAPLHRRRVGAVGRHLHHGRLRPEPAERRALGQFDLPKHAAEHIGQAVMPGEGCVCQHPPRIDELPHARVFLGEQFEEGLRLGHARPLEQVVFGPVVFREELRIGRGVVDRREPEPLGGEALVEPLPLRIGEHAFGLLAEHHGIAELPLPGHFEQLLVGRRVPEQIREPRCEGEVGERPRLLDDAEEVGIHEQVAELVDHDVDRVAAGIDIGLDRRHDGRDLVVGEVATKQPRRHPAERLLHDGDELVGLHRLEIGDRPAILPQFLVEFRWKIGRHEPLGD